MEVRLTQELERRVHQLVESGLYDSPSEVVREATRRLLHYHDQLADLQHEVNLGLAEIERGEVIEFNEAEVERIKAEGRARLQQRRPA